MTTAIRPSGIAGLGAYTPRTKGTGLAATDAPTYERRLTLMIFVVAPILGVLLRAVAGARTELTLVKGWDDLMFGLFAIAAVPRLPHYVSRLKNGWLLLTGFVIFLVVMAIKVAAVDWLRVEFFWTTFGMEMKTVWYILASMAIYFRMERLHLRHWVARIEFFAAMMILGFIFQLAQVGTLARAAAVDEANYDGFILGVGFLLCYYLRSEIKLRTWAILAVATLLTLSRTGLAALILVGGVVLLRHRQFKWIIGGLIVLTPAVIFVFVTRTEGTSVDQLDRLRMWQSFFLTLSHWNIFSWIFGGMPGVPIRYYDPYIQYFIDYQSVQSNNVAGLHPFNYHAMHIRFFLTWGLIGAAAVLGGAFTALRRGGWYLGLLFLYILIQGFSMGVVYLTAVAIPTLLVSYELWRLGAERHPVVAKRKTSVR